MGGHRHADCHAIDVWGRVGDFAAALHHRNGDGRGSRGPAFETYAGRNLGAFALGIFTLGLICTVLRVERGAYHYAGITLVVVMLIVYTQRPWLVAVHRFVEISIGLAVGLMLSALWPEPQPNR